MRHNAFRFCAKTLVILLETYHSLIKGESGRDVIGTAALLPFKVRVMYESLAPFGSPGGTRAELNFRADPHPLSFKYLAPILGCEPQKNSFCFKTVVRFPF